MGILGITNRTENWKTAAYFAPLFGAGSERLAMRLLGEDAFLRPGDVSLELFWRGVRDHFDQCNKKRDEEQATLVRLYSELFPKLRGSVQSLDGFQKLKEWNYDPEAKPTEPEAKPTEPEAKPTEEAKAKLASNIYHTEFDIVLESPGHLFVGEAKHKSTFGANSSDVLVHQLVRQYVTARILLKLLGRSHRVVPFLVGDNAGDLKKNHQVQFMQKQGWLREENILTWEEIASIAYPTPAWLPE